MAEAPKLIIGDDWKRREPEPAMSAGASAHPARGEKPSGVVVDADWKSQAQAEKERLAQTEKKAARPGEPRERGLPPADFSALVGTLVTQAFLYLGGFPDPQTGRAIVSLEHARFHIDLLSVLQTKTKPSLTPEEAEDLERAIHELRLRYVEISQAVTEMAAKRGAPGAPPPSAPLA